MKIFNILGALLVDISCSNLRGANLWEADLREADLQGANLRGANLWEADLREADLREANLQGANLRGANLRSANLQGANLRGADLQGANLRGADLQGANLSGANLWEADLQGANLSGQESFIARTRILPEGDIIGWKNCNGIIVKLLIKSDAKRSSAFGRKCRCSAATVLDIEGKTEAYGRCGFKYTIGEIVTPDSFNDDWLIECTNGIHFFITRQEAIDY